MALSHSPSIVTNGLVLCLDAGNTRSYDRDENLFVYSEQFNNALWSVPVFGTDATVTANQTTAPDGTATADLISFAPDGTGQSRKQQNIGTLSGTFTSSIFVKKVTLDSITLYVTTNQPPYPSCTYVFSTDTITNSSATSVSRVLYPDGWVRISVTATVTSHVLYSGMIGFSAGTIYAWGAQLERGSVANTYNPTTVTSKQRGATWVDLSGSGNTGTLTNGPTFDGSNGGSIVFDGTDDYIRIPSATTLNSLGASDFTVSMWVYRATLPPSGNGEMLYQSSTLDNGFVICISDVNFRIEVRDNQSTNGTLGGVLNIFTAGVWNNVVLTKQGTTYIGYSQGVSKGSFTSYQDVSTNSGFVDIGRTDWWGDSYWQGNIAQVHTYNRALSAAEIQSNFNAYRGRFGL